jgi:hypothetical protein
VSTGSGEAVPAVYEFTVVGPIGPVLREALKPCRTGPAQVHTIVRTRAHTDLVDLALWLQAHGATVAAIAVLGRGPA